MRVNKFEEMMTVASEAQGQAMMWMGRVAEKRAEGATYRAEGAKEETAAFERAMLDGQEAMGTALALLGEMGFGESTNETNGKKKMWKGVGSAGIAKRSETQGGECEETPGLGIISFRKSYTMNGVRNQMAGEVQEGGGWVDRLKEMSDRDEEKR